jgi:uncharacterized protein YciI
MKGNTKKKQFIYVLKLIPRLIDESNWTSREEDIVDNHFNHLKGLLQEGKLILAGRTLNMDKTTFGIVIFEAESEEEARQMMNDDPAVKGGVMTAQLFPYRVALMRGKAI